MKAVCDFLRVIARTMCATRMKCAKYYREYDRIIDDIQEEIIEKLEPIETTKLIVDIAKKYPDKLKEKDRYESNPAYLRDIREMVKEGNYDKDVDIAHIPVWLREEFYKKLGIDEETLESKYPPGWYDEDTRELVLKEKDVPYALQSRHGFRPESRIAWSHHNKPYLVHFYHDGTVVAVEDATHADLEKY